MTYNLLSVMLNPQLSLKSGPMLCL